MASKVKFTKNQYTALRSVINQAKNNNEFKNHASAMKEILSKLDFSKETKVRHRFKEEFFNRNPYKSFLKQITKVSFIFLNTLVSFIATMLIGDNWLHWGICFVISLLLISLLDTLIFGKYVEISEETDEKELFSSLRYANYIERFVLIAAIILSILSIFYLIFSSDQLQSIFNGTLSSVDFKKLNSTNNLLANFPNFATVFALAITIITVIDSNITNKVNNHNSKIK